MKIAVIGCGAAGLCAAGSAAGAQVTVFDHNEKAGKKIYITGKGRCNFTNVCDTETFLQNVVVNRKFLYSALAKFSPYDAVELLEKQGCKTKIERGRRAFPQSDKASDVIKALTAYAEKNGAEFRFGVNIESIRATEGGFYVAYDRKSEYFDRIIICTGGKSYPMTGSDGSAYKLIRSLGHTVTDVYPSLVGLSTKEDISAARGLTLKNISLSADGVKPIFGDLMITDDGISGPVALRLSALLCKKPFPYFVYIDLKPALSLEEHDKRILRDLEGQKNKQFKNSLDLLLPKSTIGYIIERTGILPDRQVNSITRAERRKIAETIKRDRKSVV